MAVAGVIAEYNPFHKGHAWQLTQLRRVLRADTTVVACMSGNFVQRGSFAIMNAHARAEAALHGGVDLVLELPTPWATAGAERFAQGGAAVLAATGVVTHLAFGCECAALAPLRQAAESLGDPAYPAGLRRFLGQGMTFAAARQAAVHMLAGDAADCLSQPNNLLAVEYLRALKSQGSPIIPLALPRVGAAHDSETASPYPSASAIRRMLLEGDGWQNVLPQPTSAIVSREIQAGRAPVQMETCQRALLFQLRRMSEIDFLPYDGGNEGLYRRFYAAVHAGHTLDGILALAKTKRYPLSRLRRMLLQSCLGVPQAAQGETPPYLRVLAANERGRALLGQMRKTAALPVITKPGHIRRLSKEAQRVFDQEARCGDLYALAYPDLGQAVPERGYTVSPVML